MPVVVESNVDRWAEQLARVLDGFGMDSPASGGTLGETLVETLAANISDRGLTERRGYDAEFAENKPDYLKQKVREYGESRPNVRTEHMLTRDAVEGTQEVSADGKELRWSYGKGTASPNARRSHDRTITDRQKAAWAHDPSAAGKYRPFFGLADDDERQARDIAEEALDRHLHGDRHAP